MRALRHAVYERAGGRCEVSGLALADPDRGWDLHHRRNKGMGGTLRPDTDTPVNVLAVLPEVHNSAGMNSERGWPRGLSVHGSREWAGPRGYLIPKHVDTPGRWPVLLWGARWVWLTDEGGYRPVPDALARSFPL